MKKVLFTVLPFFLAACATPLPQEQRELQFTEKTTLKQKDAYNLALAYLAKNLGDSNFAIKVKDQDSGTIITQVIFDCNELKGFMDLNRHAAQFNLEVDTKDNKARFIFEALSDRTYNAVDGSFINERVFSSESQVASVKPCAERLKSNILRAMTPAKGTSW